MLRARLLFIILLVWGIDGRADFGAELSLYGSTQEKLVGEGVTQNNGGVRLILKDQLDFSKSFSLPYNLFLKADGLTKSESEKFVFEPQELNLKWSNENNELRLGYGTIIWEGTDFINPMDIVHAKNNQDPVNAFTRSSAGVFYVFNAGGFSLDLVYIPLQTKSLLPGEQSVWWPREFTLPVNTEDLILKVPPSLNYKIKDDEILEKALNDNFAVRLKQQFDTWDVSFGGFQGASAAPALAPQVNLTVIEVSPEQIFLVNSPVNIQPIYYRNRVWAGALSKTFESFIVRFAGQHVQPLTLDPRVPGWSDLGVVAIEKTATVLGSDVTFLAQFISARRKEDGNLSLLSSLTEKAFMLGWRWPFNETFTWNAAVYQEQKKFSSYVHCDLTISYGDHWKQNFSVDVLSGTPESTLGTYNRNDRVATAFTFLH